MHLDQAAQTPLIVSLGNEKISVPLFTLEDFIAWGKLEDAERAGVATAGFEPFARVQLLSYYNPMPSTIDDLRQRVRSPRGIRHIPLTCLSRASVVERDGASLPTPEPLSGERAASIVASTKANSLEALAVALADVSDKQDAGTGQADSGKVTGDSPLPGTRTTAPAS